MMARARRGGGGAAPPPASSSPPPYVLVIDWIADSAQATAAVLRAAGWTVELESEDGGRAYRRVRTQTPEAVVVSLGAKPSHGRETIRSIVQPKATRGIRILAIGGSEADRTKLAALAPQVECLGTAQELARALGPGSGRTRSRK
ncbi:MAG: hypothetical protein E6J90_44685 [Deltaproteobacteria bacterium]|nr:MAG: hypothetical protein E6J91_49015 [Deltaproteobacteria bacterium]TMQ06938.1 MAG: hypothetical protein E6J90_44685 [Deltaproteobacteria bacterium]